MEHKSLCPSPLCPPIPWGAVFQLLCVPLEQFILETPLYVGFEIPSPLGAEPNAVLHLARRGGQHLEALSAFVAAGLY